MYTAHHEKYQALCEKHHVVWSTKSPHSVGVTVETLIKKYQEDEHLNNVPLRRWDSLAYAFLACNRHGGLSLAEAVCMQKHAAVELIKKAIRWNWGTSYVLPSFATSGCEKGEQDA